MPRSGVSGVTGIGRGHRVVMAESTTVPKGTCSHARHYEKRDPAYPHVGSSASVVGVQGAEPTAGAAFRGTTARGPLPLRSGDRRRPGGGLGRELRGGLGVRGDVALQRLQKRRSEERRVGKECREARWTRV